MFLSKDNSRHHLRGSGEQITRNPIKNRASWLLILEFFLSLSFPSFPFPSFPSPLLPSLPLPIAHVFMDFFPVLPSFFAYFCFTLWSVNIPVRGFSRCVRRSFTRQAFPGSLLWARHTHAHSIIFDDRFLPCSWTWIQLALPLTSSFVSNISLQWFCSEHFYT